MLEDKKEKLELYSKRVRAGKRTYFFDVKATRNNDFYLTITESKKKFKDDGFFYEKHKIFLYREDFFKFIDALNEAVTHLKSEGLLEETEENNIVDNNKIEDSEFPDSNDVELKWD
jgi:Protein of unknown function (DUF3276)